MRLTKVAEACKVMIKGMRDPAGLAQYLHQCSVFYANGAGHDW